RRDVRTGESARAPNKRRRVAVHRVAGGGITIASTSSKLPRPRRFDRMNVLRILVVQPITADYALHWSLHDASGACVRSGRDGPDDLPAADRVEIVVAANQVRLAAVTLPPLPPNRIAAAAGFALEDRLASTGEPPMLAISSQRADGRVIVAIVN